MQFFLFRRGGNSRFCRIFVFCTDWDDVRFQVVIIANADQDRRLRGGPSPRVELRSAANFFVPPMRVTG